MLLNLQSCGRKVKYKEKEVVKEVESSLICNVYDMTGMSFSALPDFASMVSLGEIKPKELNNPNTNNLTPFETFVDTPHVSLVEQFGMVCEGDLKVVNGNYQFNLYSDDGSKLFINSILAVDHNGNHGFTKKTGNLTLSKGTVKVKVEYFNGLGNKGLQLTMRRPNSSIEEIIKF